MAQPKSVVGLDVHATQTHACVLCPETGELRSKRLNGPPRRALDFLEGLHAPVLAVYEAGPTGYGLASAVRALEQRRGVAERVIEEGWPESPWAETIARLRCLRGIDTLTALGLCSEAGDLRRFEHPSSLTAYFGIVPSEHSSGEQRRRGPITKAGSAHARRLLVEAPTTTAMCPGWRGRWSVASAASTRERVRSAGVLRSACIVAGSGCGWSEASPPTWSGSPWLASWAACVGGGSAGLSGAGKQRALDAVGAARDLRRPARRRRAACVASWGNRRIMPPAAPASRLQATRRIGGHGVASPRIMRLTMQSMCLESARAAPRAPRRCGCGPSGARSVLGA